MALASGLGVCRTAWRPLVADTYGTGWSRRSTTGASTSCCSGRQRHHGRGSGLLRPRRRITDSRGAPVGPGGAALTGVAHVDLAGLDFRLRLARVTLASDVDNPLTGPSGAAAVFGPQKGASPRDVEVLERGLRQFASVVERAVGHDLSGEPGAGAAGGTGFAALFALGARRSSGADFVLGEIGLEEALRTAALVVVGEGRFDEQSLRGKAPVGVAKAAGRHGVPVVVVAGDVRLSAEQLRAAGVSAAWSLLNRTGSLAAAMEQAPALLAQVGRELPSVVAKGGAA
ncbi:glycerate kinase [Lentzea guizhouensis]|uniref:glycerate kinase n=1 Tax=Lentzea guizhouensis TaxID=1586287 RepID=UPI003AABED3C